MRRPLKELVRSSQNVTSVYFRAGREDSAARWRAIVLSLVTQGVPAHDLAALTGFVDRLSPTPRDVVLFAADGKLLWHREMPGTGVVDRAAFGRPALILPLLAWLAQHPPCVQVVVDRTGADVVEVARGGFHTTTHAVAGPDDEITRGGRRNGDHPRIERRAKSSWWHNAGAVAEATCAALKRVDAELLVVAGQPRIVKLMLRQMPKGLRVRIHAIPGGRRDDGSGPARRACVSRAVAKYVRQRELEAWEAFRGYILSVRGVRDTLRALAAGRVTSLFVTDELSDPRRAWFGPDLLCSEEPGSELLEGRMVDVATRAALLTDADVHVMPPGRVIEGIAATCRFA